MDSRTWCASRPAPRPRSAGSPCAGRCWSRRWCSRSRTSDPLLEQVLDRRALLGELLLRGGDLALGEVGVLDALHDRVLAARGGAGEPEDEAFGNAVAA